MAVCSNIIFILLYFECILQLNAKLTVYNDPIGSLNEPFVFTKDDISDEHIFEHDRNKREAIPEHPSIITTHVSL